MPTMPRKASALLFSVPLLFQSGVGTDAHSCVHDDGVCLLQHKTSSSHLDFAPASTPSPWDPSPWDKHDDRKLYPYPDPLPWDQHDDRKLSHEDKLDQSDDPDDPEILCSAVGARMWVYKSAVQQFVSQIMVKSAKDVPSDLTHENGESGNFYYKLSNIKMKVSVDSDTVVAMHYPNKVSADAAKVKVEINADYEVSTDEGEVKWTGKVAGTSNSQSSLSAVFTVGASKYNGALDLSMGSTVDLSFDEFKFDGGDVPEDLPSSLKDTIQQAMEARATANLRKHYNDFAQGDLKSVLRYQDMRIPLKMDPPLDGFFLAMPICDIEVDKELIVASMEGVVSHRYAGALTYKVPMPTPVMGKPVPQSGNIQADITEWTVNGGLWLAYQMGRFHFTPNQILGEHKERSAMRRLSFDRSLGQMEERSAGQMEEGARQVSAKTGFAARFVDFSSEFQAYEVPTAKFVDNSTVQFSFPMDCDYYINAWKAPTKYLSVRSTVLLEMKVRTPNTENSPIEGSVYVVSISKPEIRFLQDQYHWDAIDGFFHQWVNWIYIPVFNVFYEQIMDLVHMNDLSEETGFDKTVVHTLWQHMVLSTDVKVSPFP